MRLLIPFAAALLGSTAASAATQIYTAELAPARGLPPLGFVQARFDPGAQTIEFLVRTRPSALAPGAHQLHLHANYAGNLRIGDPLTQQIAAVPPALSDDQDGDGVIEVFEAVPLIGESWWTLATVAVGDDGVLNWRSGLLSTAEPNLFAPDPIDLNSPGVDSPDDIDFPTDIDNIGFYRSALDSFPLLAFDIHGAPDPAGIGNTPGEVDGTDGFEGLRPALAGSFLSSGGNPLPAVPEPASWAMLIAGFGLTGAVMRRRQRVASA